jgi:hypothetical protein
VNCEEEEELCEEYEVFQTPKIVYFPENTAESFQVYQGKPTAEKVIEFAVPKILSFVQLIKASNFEDYLNNDKPKVVLFTEKKSTPPLLKVLSKEFKDRVAIGLVRSSETELCAQFGITTYPTLLALKSDRSGDVFSGKHNREEMESWIRNFSYTAPKLTVGVRELTRSLYIQSSCNAKDSNLCVLVFKTRDESVEEVKAITNKFKSDPIKFFWVDKAKYPDFHAQLGGH